MENVMKKVGKASSFLTKYIGIIIICFSMIAFFLARWIRVDNQLYIHLFRCCHVWYGAYNQDERF